MLAAYLNQYHMASDGVLRVLSGVLTSSSDRKLKIIELGSGCGIVGIALAQSVPMCEVLLTDLPEAKEILKTNLAAIPPANDSIAISRILDWEEDLPTTIAQQTFDLVFVADCTYNPSSAPYLVKTLDMLVSNSPEAIIVLATKLRHPSEAVFFDLMETAGIARIGRTVVPLLHGSKSSAPDTSSNIEIYLFKKRLKSSS